MRLELTRKYFHYPLKIACLPFHQFGICRPKPAINIFDSRANAPHQLMPITIGEIFQVSSTVILMKSICLMLQEGLEPSWPQSHLILSQARLPVPPPELIWGFNHVCTTQTRGLTHLLLFTSTVISSLIQCLFIPICPHWNVLPLSNPQVTAQDTSNSFLERS